MSAFYTPNWTGFVKLSVLKKLRTMPSVKQEAKPIRRCFSVKLGKMPSTPAAAEPKAEQRELQIDDLLRPQYAEQVRDINTLARIAAFKRLTHGARCRAVAKATCGIRCADECLKIERHCADRYAILNAIYDTLRVCAVGAGIHSITERQFSA